VSPRPPSLFYSFYLALAHSPEHFSSSNSLQNNIIAQQPKYTDARNTSSRLPRLSLEAILDADLARGLAMISCTSS
jgi:hypothetical protein